MAAVSPNPFPIVDAHQHFWDPRVNYHPWLCDQPPIPFRYGDYSALRRPYLPADYFADAARQLLKDLEMVNEFAGALKAPVPMMGGALSLYRMLAHLGHTELDTAAVLKLYER